MIFADALLARRLEAAEAANARGLERPARVAVLEARDGGCAVFAGADSPLVACRRDRTEWSRERGAKLTKSRRFSASRGAKATFDVCPLADPDFVAALSARGYRITEFNNVLVKRLAGTEPTLTPRARRAVAGRGGPLVVYGRTRLLRTAGADHRGDGRRPRHFPHAGRDVLLRIDRERAVGRGGRRARSAKGWRHCSRTAPSRNFGGRGCIAS